MRVSELTHGALISDFWTSMAICLRVPYIIEMTELLECRKKFFKVIPKEEVYNLTGNQFENFNTIFQLYSLVQKRPWILEKADTLLLDTGFI